MRTFLELKNYSKQKLEAKNLTFNEGKANFQVYQSDSVQLNISFDSQSPVIKFEERKPDVFTVAVDFDGRGTVDYALSKDFQINDSITKLIDVFPNAFRIDDVVSALLSIKFSK